MSESRQERRQPPEARQQEQENQEIDEETSDDPTPPETTDSEDDDSSVDLSERQADRPDLHFNTFLEKFVLVGIMAIGYYFIAQTIEALYKGESLKIPKSNPRDDGPDRSFWETCQAAYELGKKWLIKKKKIAIK